MEGFLRILQSLIYHFVADTEQERAKALTEHITAHFHTILQKSQEMSSWPLLGALNIAAYSNKDDSSTNRLCTSLTKAYRGFGEALRYWLLAWFDSASPDDGLDDFIEALKRQCQHIHEVCVQEKYPVGDNWCIHPDSIETKRAQIQQVFEGFRRQKTWEATQLSFCPSMEIGVIQKFLELLKIQYYVVDDASRRCLRAVMALPLEDHVKAYCDEIYSPVYKPELERLRDAIEAHRGHDKQQAHALAKQYKELQEKYRQHFHDKFPQSFFALFRTALIYDHQSFDTGRSFFQKACECMAYRINEDEQMFIEGLFRRFRLQAKLDADSLRWTPSLLETHALLYKLGRPMRAQYRELEHLSDLDFFAQLFSWQKLQKPQNTLVAKEFVQILFALLMLYMRQDENNVSLWPKDFVLESAQPELRQLSLVPYLYVLEKRCAEALFYDIRVHEQTLMQLAEGVVSKRTLQHWLVGLDRRSIYHPEQTYSALYLFKPVPVAQTRETTSSIEHDIDDASLYQQQREEFNFSRRCTIL